MSNKTKLLIVLLLFVLAAGVLFYVYKILDIKQPTNNPIFTLTPSISDNNQEYVKGYVLVTFKEGITYKQAEDLLNSYGFDISNTNDYWKATNFQPSQTTILKNIDLFEIYVGVGREDEVVKTLNNSNLVRVAEKNFIVKIH